MQLGRTLPRRSKPSQRAFTLTEVCIVLGMIGLILSAVWVAASALMANRHVEQAARDIMALSDSVKSLYSGKDFETATLGEITPILISNGLIPNDMYDATTTLQWQGTKSRPMNPWGGQTAIYALTNQTFRVSMYGLPTSACIRLIQLIGSQANGTTGPIAAGSWFTGNVRTDDTTGAYDQANQVSLAIVPGSAIYTKATVMTPTIASATCAGNATYPSISGQMSAEFDFMLH